MELKAGRLSDTITIAQNEHLTVTLSRGSIKLFLKGKEGRVKICFFSSHRHSFSVDVTEYDTLVMEAFDDCFFTYQLS